MGILHAMGAEEQVLSQNGGGLWNTVTSAPTISSTQKKNGTYSYNFNKTASSCSLTKTISGTPTTLCASFYIYFTTLPTGSHFYITRFNVTSGTYYPIFLYYPVTGYFGVSFNGLAVDVYRETTVNTGEWYLIDLNVNIGAGTQTVDWKVNGVAQTQSSTTSASNTFTNIVIGGTSTDTFNFYIDDIVYATNDLYPIGDHVCQYLSPNADGTHNAGTNIIEDNAGTDIGTTTAYDKINSVPTGAPSSTTYLRQAGTGSYYAEVTMGDMTSGKTPIGLEGFLAYTAATTTADRAATFAWDGSTQYGIWGTSASTADYSDGSTASLYYKSAVIGITLSETNVNALKVRFGYSGDVSPIPYLIDVWFVVVYTDSNKAVLAQTQGNQTISSAGTLKIQAVVSQAQEDQSLLATGANVGITTNGVLNQTQDGQTPIALGAVKIQAILDQAQGDQAPTATGAVRVQSALNQVQADQSILSTGSGVTANNGALNQSQDAQTPAIAGALKVQAVVNQTQAGQTATIAGTLDIQAVVSQTQGNQTSLAAGALRIQGVIAQSQDSQTPVITGVGYVTTTGVLIQTQADQSPTIAGVLEISGSVAQVQDGQQANITGAVYIKAVVSQTQAGQIPLATGSGAIITNGMVNQVQGDQLLFATSNLKLKGIISVTQESNTLYATNERPREDKQTPDLVFYKSVREEQRVDYDLFISEVTDG